MEQMTQEQYNRAVEINGRLLMLRGALEELNCGGRSLTYKYDKGIDSGLCAEYRLQPISDILDRHDKMIREEIDAEIKRVRNLGYTEPQQPNLFSPTT